MRALRDWSAPLELAEPVEFHGLLLRELGVRDYHPVWQGMQAFTQQRDSRTSDELWLVEHPPVFTLGQAGDAAHVLNSGSIPVVDSDRGGQVTYHGPGQAVVYALFDLRRAGLGVRSFVRLLEQAVIDALASHSVEAARLPGAPGVYVEGAKLAALGIRVRKGRSYHGVAINVDTDLAPYNQINPCGYPGMAVTRTRDLGVDWNVKQAGLACATVLARLLASTSASPA